MSIWDAFERISRGREPQGKIEYIIAGLGNPGIQYENSRHNAGFMAVAALEESTDSRRTGTSSTRLSERPR